jgi:hypothetical protein
MSPRGVSRVRFWVRRDKDTGWLLLFDRCRLASFLGLRFRNEIGNLGTHAF